MDQRWREKVEALREEVEVKHKLGKFVRAAEVEDALKLGREITEHIVNLVLGKEGLKSAGGLYADLEMLGTKPSEPKGRAKNKKDKNDKNDASDESAGPRGNKPPLPQQIYSNLHNLRIYGNLVVHEFEPGGVDRKDMYLSETDMEVALGQLLRAVEWYYQHYKKGPRFAQIYTKKPLVRSVAEMTSRWLSTFVGGAQKFALAALIVLTLAGGLAWQFGLFGKLFSAHVYVNTTLTGPRVSTRGQPVTFQARVQADDGSTPQSGEVVFSVDGQRQRPVGVDQDGMAEFQTDDLEVGNRTIGASFVASGRYRPGQPGNLDHVRSETVPPTPIHVQPKEPPPAVEDPDRYGAVEVTAGGVRAVAVTLKSFEKDWFRLRRIDPGDRKWYPGRPQDFDPYNNELFTEDYAHNVAQRVSDAVGWLKNRSVPKDHIQVVIGSGVQAWSEGPVHLWKKNDPCVEQLLSRLQKVVERDRAEAIGPLEEAGCVAVGVVPSNVESALVIDVGRDNVKIVSVKPSRNTFPKSWEGVGIDIPGTKTLDLWTRRKHGLQSGAPVDRNGDFAGKLAELCRSTVDRDLVDQQPVSETAEKRVFVVGDATRAVCQFDRETSPRPASARLTGLQIERCCARAVTEAVGNPGGPNEVPPGELLAAAEILRALGRQINVMGKEKNLESDAVTFIDGRGADCDWLSVYLEKRFKARDLP
jgi:hypothetical protein